MPHRAQMRTEGDAINTAAWIIPRRASGAPKGAAAAARLVATVFSLRTYQKAPADVLAAPTFDRRIYATLRRSMQHQDWKPVVMRKPSVTQTKERRQAELRVSQRTRGVDEDPDRFARATVSKAMARQIQTARVGRGLSQKALAAQLSLPMKTVQAYESGKATPNGAHIALLNRALGIRIRRDDKRRVQEQKRRGAAGGDD